MSVPTPEKLGNIRAASEFLDDAAESARHAKWHYSEDSTPYLVAARIATRQALTLLEALAPAGDPE